MREKKICSLDVSMDEPMLKALKGLAEADGISASELVRMLISTMIEERAAYYSRLHSIFGDDLFKANPNHTGSHPDDKAGSQLDTRLPHQIPAPHQESARTFK